MKKIVVVAILALSACVGVADELSRRLSDCLVNKNNAACLKLADMYKGKDEKLASVFYKTASDLGEQYACAYLKRELWGQFLGAIERKLHENWNSYERNGNFVAQIEYQIESNGFFRYTSVTKSGNTEFDAKVMDFLSTLDGKYIATPPYKKPYKGSARLSDEVMGFSEFLVAVEKRLHEDWNLYERIGNFTVVIKFQIDSNGFFRHTSVTKSGNAKFDTKVLHFLSALEGRYIAVPPNKRVYKGSASLSDEVSLNKDKQ